MAISLRQLSYFVALAEEGGFGAAAQRMNVSQPALSQQVKELETRLHATLVERLPRGIRLTRSGAEVLERARRVLAEVGDLERAVRLGGGLSGRLTLGLIPTVAPYLLPGALTRLRAHDVTLDIRVSEAQTAPLLTALGEGRLDAAVVAAPVHQSGVETLSLVEDRFLYAVSDRHSDRLPRRPRPEAVGGETLLLLDEGHCLADQALSVCGLARRPRIDFGAASLTTLAGLVAEGLGVTLLPELAVPHERAAAPGLALRRFARPEPARDIVLAVRSGSAEEVWTGELARHLRDAAADLVAAARALLPLDG